jgi:hypothetical protein
MRRFAQIVFPPWVRTYPKSTSAEFFVPAQTKIAINSLTTAIDAHEHQFFDKLLWGLVTSTIFDLC